MNKDNDFLNKFLTALYGIAVFFLIITASIGLPIYFRFFYYLHVNALGLPESTGYDFATIKQAYDQMLNFLTLPFTEFGTGVFSYSEAGKAHFVDCKALFNLNLFVLIPSTVTVVVFLILSKKKKISLVRPFGLDASFFSAVSIFLVAGILALIVASDFDSAFVAFHHLFFPGKDNWNFNPRVDQIINILPAQFFMNCAILIASGIVLSSLTIIIFQLVKRSKERKNK